MVSRKRKAPFRRTKRFRRWASSARYCATTRRYAKRATDILIRNALVRTPLPPKLVTTFSYPPTAVTFGSVLTNTAIGLLRLNSIFDFDVNNAFGNQKPLQFAQLLSSTGPYKSFRVNSWKVKFVVDNVTAAGATTNWGIEVVVAQGAFLQTDIDTWSELISYPNVQRKMLQGHTANYSRCVMEMNGKVEDFASNKELDADFIGSYIADPTQVIFGAIGINNFYNPLLLAVNANVLIYAEFEVTLYDTDGVIS